MAEVLREGGGRGREEEGGERGREEEGGERGREEGGERGGGTSICRLLTYVPPYISRVRQ